MKRLIFAMALILALAPAARAAENNTATKPKEKKMTEQTTQTLKAKDALHPLVEVKTSLGDFVLELDADKAPISTINFIQYAKEGFYNGLIFHRVLEGFMIQGGGMYPDNREKPGKRPAIKNEWQNGLKNAKGTIAMARIGYQPDSATSQFFINVSDKNGFLDQPNDGAGYAVFGKVVKGEETIEKIRTTPVEFDGREKARPVTPVVIKEVKLISEFDQAAAEKKIKK